MNMRNLVVIINLKWGQMHSRMRFRHPVSSGWFEILFACLLLCPIVQCDAAPVVEVSKGIEQAALETLQTSLTHDTDWVRVHAAEFMVALGVNPEKVCELFVSQAATHGDQAPYRIGVWRVLAIGDFDDLRRSAWLDKIRQAFLDSAGPDRLHAVETLGKLGYQPTVGERAALQDYIRERPSSEAVMAQWVLANGRDEAEIAALVGYLDNDDALTRLRAGAALSSLGPLPDQYWQRLSVRALSEPEDSPARVHLLEAAWAMNPNGTQAEDVRVLLAGLLQSDDPAERKYAAGAFAKHGEVRDVVLLHPLLQDADSDVRVFSACAILRILRRIPKVIAPLDWAIIGFYFLSMLGIGLFFSRRTNTADDYLLGGRNQRPWAVGLSLFATLLSTLSYIAYPGEIIKHGPMIVGGLLAYPLIFLLVGFLFIPVVMRLHVTSAYEILEQRLGLGVRMCGSVIFILLRMAWMAAIIYVTTSAVIIPVLGLDPRWAPWIGVVIGVITLVYTSLGGLQAVIWTDVVQTFILFFGALATLALISIHFGGFGWFPVHWAPNWDPPVVWFNADVRVTLAGSFMMMLGWFVCTAGSDQMAIQRYLATRDAGAARRMLATSLSASLLVTLLLLFMGFALLAYFQANPQLLPDGQSLQKSADQLFPRYIVFGLPQGISGLVVAGLLAAAMSSLSSGVNSVATVIQMDFVERFSRKLPTGRASVRQARWISAAVGVVVILLSLSVGQVKGNMLEVVNKVGNLLTAPLFLLFFMALYVPWARSLATLIAVVSSTVVAVAIAYFEVFGLSFIWITPVSLAVGVLLGSGLSLIPLGFTARQRVEMSK